MATSDTPTVAEQFHDADQQWRADSFGMWVFLATEAMMFGGLFLAFAIYRSEHTAAFAEAAHHLKLHLGAINTVLLIVSSFAMSLAEPAVEAGRRRTVMALVAATILLGLGFLGIKGYEYYTEYKEGLMPFLGLEFHGEPFRHEEVRLFFGFYYVMTALHAAHMAIGLGLMAVLLVLTWLWRDGSVLTRQVRIIGLYWAFVDVVWLLLFPTLYLLGGQGG